MQQEEIPKSVYIIPFNFALEGKTGGFNTRNLLEAAGIFAALMVLDILFLPGIKYKLYGGIVCLLPAFISLTGINGLPLSEYLTDLIHYRACNTVYAKPTPELILIRERQIIREKHRMIKEREAQEAKEQKAQMAAEKRQRKQRKKNRDLDDDGHRRGKKGRNIDVFG